MSWPDVIMRILFTLGASGFGLMLLTVGTREAILQRRTLRAAVPVPAVITASSVALSISADSDPRLGHDTSTTSYRPDIRFRYEVNGSPFESEMLTPTAIVRGYASREEAQADIDPYPVGAAVTAFVDPSEPTRAFLRPVASWAPTIYVVVGLVLLPIAYLLYRIL